MQKMVKDKHVLTFIACIIIIFYNYSLKLICTIHVTYYALDLRAGAVITDLSHFIAAIYA